jgi:hypothetical protein
MSNRGIWCMVAWVAAQTMEHGLHKTRYFYFDWNLRMQCKPKAVITQDPFAWFQLSLPLRPAWLTSSQNTRR